MLLWGVAGLNRVCCTYFWVWLRETVHTRACLWQGWSRTFVVYYVNVKSRDPLFTHISTFIIYVLKGLPHKMEIVLKI